MALVPRLFSLSLVLLVLLLLLALWISHREVHGAETVPCPTQLEESHNQALIIAQSRDQTEQRLAQAIRANREMSAAVKKLTEDNRKLADDLKATKEAPKEGATP